MRLASIIFGATLIVGCTDGDSNYFQPLSQPPQSVGTCLGGQNWGGVWARHLVMTARDPQRQREIFVDKHSYIELVFVSSSPTSIKSEDIAGHIDDNGRVSGLHTTGTASVDMGTATDSSLAHALRRLPMKQSEERNALTPSEQRRVKEMLSWVLRRCPENLAPVTAAPRSVVIHERR